MTTPSTSAQCPVALDAVIAAIEDQMPATQDMESTMICEALERAIVAVRALTASPSPAASPASPSGVREAEIKRIKDWLLERNRDHLAKMVENTRMMRRESGDAEMFLDAAILISSLASEATPAPTSGGEDGGDVLAGWCQPNGITKQAQYDIDQAIGGTYELPDGRSFWLDHVTVKEIMRRAIPYIAAECERHRLAGGRAAKPAKSGGC